MTIFTLKEQSECVADYGSMAKYTDTKLMQVSFECLLLDCGR